MALVDADTALAWSKQAVAVQRNLSTEARETLMGRLLSRATRSLEFLEPEHAVASVAQLGYIPASGMAKQPIQPPLPGMKVPPVLATTYVN